MEFWVPHGSLRVLNLFLLSKSWLKHRKIQILPNKNHRIPTKKDPPIQIVDVLDDSQMFHPCHRSSKRWTVRYCAVVFKSFNPTFLHYFDFKVLPSHEAFLVARESQSFRCSGIWIARLRKSKFSLFWNFNCHLWSFFSCRKKSKFLLLYNLKWFFDVFCWGWLYRYIFWLVVKPYSYLILLISL